MTWAAELADLARAGAEHPATPYDAERFARIAELAASLAAHGGLVRSESRRSGTASTLGEVAALAAKTPYSAADAAVFDSAGRLLLIQRADSGLWALPGGAAEVGDRPAAVAEREAWEETGLWVRAEQLLGVYAVPARQGTGYPLLVMTFRCRRLGGAPIVTHETRGVGYFARESLPPLHRGHDRRVGDAFAALAAGDAWPAAYD